MQVKSIAECSKGSILQYYWRALSYHLSLRPLFWLFWVAVLHRVYYTTKSGFLRRRPIWYTVRSFCLSHRQAAWAQMQSFAQLCFSQIQTWWMLPKISDSLVFTHKPLYITRNNSSIPTQSCNGHWQPALIALLPTFDSFKRAVCTVSHPMP